MKISIVGSGYVGLVTGACLAKLGNSVVLIDVIEEKIQRINSRRPTVFEPGLDAVLSEAVGKGALRATADFSDGIGTTELTFICVGTPSRDDGSQDLTQVAGAAESIGSVLKEKSDYHSVVTKSTVVPGTTLKTVGPIVERASGKRAGVDFGLGMNPEFLKEGDAVNDFFRPDRVVIGAVDAKTRERLSELYSPLAVPVFHTDCTTAEMIKYSSNIFLAARVALVNELGNVSKALGIDVREVAKAVGMDRRIGPLFLKAGAGFGGSCFRKDASALSRKARELGVSTPIIDSVLMQNDAQPLRLVELLEGKLKIKGKRIAVLGLSFKPNSDDVRDAPSLKVVDALAVRGAYVVAYDPVASDNFRKLRPDIEYAKSARSAVNSSDAVVIVTEWEEFSDPMLYGTKPVIDGRGITKTENYEGVCW